MPEKTYELHLAGLVRQLPLRRVSDHITVPSFVMLGDTQLVENCADALYEKLPKDADYLVCPEAKAIPLTHALAKRLGIDYIVIRKTVKAYMENPIIADVQSITTAVPQHLVMDSADVQKIYHKRVIIVDDVVSTGGSLRAVENILSKTGCTVIAKAAPLLEDGGYDGKDLIYLQRHPIFRD
ncbi:MAG: phosphoribosyltransferase family protein [Pyramidobacter sp.]|jgi:adenine phosphoribosyltransferase